jgi:hypothetical protein
VAPELRRSCLARDDIAKPGYKFRETYELH